MQKKSQNEWYLEECASWIKSHHKPYLDKYFPGSVPRATRKSLLDLKCPFCSIDRATIHLIYGKMDCDCLPRPLKLIEVVQVFEPNPYRALERLTGIKR